ncbi:MAG TPA: hypothetical protein VJ826_14850, partial [Candidatus Polarisedimenticolaceae bacterium]|nr:hypothetical protein [Candidatus Polarisedimenticolaceae bacterium]
MEEKRQLRVGHATPDHCRVCKMERTHTVAAVDPRGGARVRCDTCGSVHDYRGGKGSDPISVPEMGSDPVFDNDLERTLRRIIREEAGLTPVTPADKWRGGELILKPGREGLQAKSIPIDTFFAKIVMLRNRLRVLEQQINAADVPDEFKLKLQGYVTG